MLFRVRTPPACLLPEVSTCTPEACVPYSMRQRLIILITDRHPDASLLPASGEWRVSSYTSSFPAYDLDPNNLEQMTVGVKPASPSQPTLLARDVETILPSRFAGTITIASSTTKNAGQTKSGNLGRNGIEHGRGKDEESSDDSTDYESED